jgi:1-deoxy-D-xylulose-5-phosphate reductoisomerase
MTFLAPDARRFPGLALAWEVLAGPTGSAAVLNAANEVAVQAFLDGAIGFDQIHQVNRGTLDAWSAPAVTELEDLLAIDQQARVRAADWVRRLGAR